MGDKTAIEWTDATWNPMVGCSKVSPGCDKCYAIGVAHRGLSEHHRGLTVRVEGSTEWNGEIHRAPDPVFYKPLEWKKPRRIFVNSLSDLFHPAVPLETILEVWSIMARCPQHTFQILTKRPQRMAKIVGSMAWGQFGEDEPYLWPPIDCGHDLDDTWVEPATEADVDGTGGESPLPNVWLGVSIENNTYAWRANHLRNTPAAVRWISAEPLLGPLDELDLTGIDWVVAGGESGAGARPMHPEWVRDLRDRCKWRCEVCGATWIRPGAALSPTGGDECFSCGGGMLHTSWLPGPAFLFKQWGAWCPDVDVATGLDTSESMSRLGKKAAGRVLDGRTWDEYPEVRS